MKKTILSITMLAILGLGLMSAKKNTETYKVRKTCVTTFQNSNKGKETFTKICAACHQATGAGIPGAFPPLAKSDYLNADVNRAIRQVIKGSTGKITVNGKVYNTPMPPQGTLSDQEIADVLTYVYGSWGNTNKKITPAMVKAQRK